LVTGLDLPEMDGFKLISILRKNPLHDSMHILAVGSETGGDMEVMNAMVISAGADCYLPPPTDGTEFQDAIRTFLRLPAN
jgi:DNA-binding response OmpR family regulator